MRRLRWFVLFGALALPAAGCKQGPGDRCQIDSDCQNGLVCSTNSKTCQQTNEIPQADGMPLPPPDAEAIDGPPADASDLDAPPTADAVPADAVPMDAP